ncbi:L,D-transpeptidase family protein [Afifella pfennigii]|uniref:L,D-transpeptidase family protein n=1 Tax=Afifella pfennigii TaxID=209897 RepID=UPI00068BFC95|nr:L,D-transpeptidase family protein [Afifella pfennigii]
MSPFSLLRPILCAAALSMPVAALAQNAATPVNQSEWADTFDSGPRTAPTVASNVPVLSPYTLPAMDQAIEWYQGLVDAGGWVQVPADTVLKIGMRHPNVLALRQRLVASGDLRQVTGAGDAFDSYVQAAVMRFQERHGIPADGMVGPSTFAALNVPAHVRLGQLKTNRERIAPMKDAVERYVMVNVPGAQIEVVEGGRVVSRHTAVVGKVDRQTPLLSSRIHEINFNPYWTVPRSIIRKDLIPKMQKQPSYLTDNRIRIFNQQGEEIPPSQVNWNSDEAVNYMFKQDPGDQNSLGSVRINFHNPHAVFLHDTPSKGLFGSDYRFESSGCVRVMNVRELVAWVLRGNGYTRATVDQAIRSGERLDVKVENPPALFTVYFTAWTTGDGVVHFRDDIYNFDGPGVMALNQPAELIGSPVPQ